jgi:hypothetical protein
VPSFAGLPLHGKRGPEHGNRKPARLASLYSRSVSLPLRNVRAVQSITFATSHLISTEALLLTNPAHSIRVVTRWWPTPTAITMQSRSARSEKPGAATQARPGAFGRPAARPATASATTGTTRPIANGRVSSLRQPTASAAAASRLDRTAAPSPAPSVSSVSTAGTKRKEREFEVGGLGQDTNINVVVRCRGRNEREVSENSAVVVSTEGVKGNVVELSMGPNALTNKTYNFDRVFSQAADQSVLYDAVVAPILDEVSIAPSTSPPPLLCPRPRRLIQGRCSKASTAPFLPTARRAPERPIPCRAT